MNNAIIKSMEKKHLLFLFILIFWNISIVNGQENTLNLRVDDNLVLYQLKGGIGASWHSLVKDIPLENEKYDYPVRFNNPRGSAFAGNPPLSDTVAWKQLYRHARWLGLNFLRVELSQRIYEPEQNVFDWENEEMQVLYRILDWCEANHADVFLQQMWGDVAWNAFPGVHPLLSAPKSLDDYANGITALLEHLTLTKKYSCIKYFSITNEPPGGTWGYWWCYGSGSGSVTPAWKAVRETLDAKNINIPLSGPDWTSLPPFDTAKIDFDKYIGAYDIHSYGGIDNEGEVILSDWSRWAHEHKKPFFLSEFGNMNLGWGTDNPGPKSFEAALSNANDVIRGLNMGVDGFNRWSFTNRGDIDGQWQLVRTYDTEKKEYTADVTPEKEAYYGFAVISRFLGKYASVVHWQTDWCIEGVKPAAFKNRDGNLVILIVNKKKKAVKLNLTLLGSLGQKPYQFYQITKEMVTSPSFRLDPQKTITGLNKQKTLELLPGSITVLTTYNLKHNDLGIME